MRHIWSVVLIAAIGGCGNEAEVTQPLRAQVQVDPFHYQVATLSSPGPGLSQGGAINNQGWVAGFSGQADGSRQATLWRGGSVLPLGTLGGTNSGVQWPGLNNVGMIVGISQTATTDTLHEFWSCEAFIPANDQMCLGFVWENGVMTRLSTLGGNQGFAAGVNNRGQVVGWAETAVVDPTCNAPQVLQFRGALWEPRTGVTRQLPPFPGDSTSAATAINNRSQVVGISGECDVAIGRRSATHAVLWENGTVTDLGNLGGDFWHTPMAINERGDVVGFANPPDGDFDGDSVRAFLWARSGGMQDLGKLPGDDFSQALGINERGQIVGVSCGSVCRAILWQDGHMYKLQDLVPGFADHLWSARDINDSGQITGRMIQLSTGRRLPFVATPIP
jgi:probable HAF family extracellular repeat protein